MPSNGKMLCLLAILSLFLSAQCSLENVPSNHRIYYTREIIEAEGYPAESHHVVTSDGYILELHRIPFGKNSQETKSRPVVFLMHGLLGASNSFIYLGPKNGMAYNLADAGYDVWMGNARGTRNSRRHISLDPESNKKLFFDFSFEDIALVDLPTMIDYVLDRTGQRKLHYIGHSQGGTVFLILNSMKTEYSEKIASAHLLAGVGYQTNFPNSQLKTLAATTDTVYNLFRMAGNVELLPPDSKGLFKTSASKGTIDSILDIDVSEELIGGASLKQVAHFGQNIRDKKFRRWDYGALSNMVQYGKLSPPAYELSKINLDLTLHYSLSDVLLSETDVLLMVKDIPNAKVRKVARDSFTHLDYVSSDDSKKLVTDYIIETLARY